MKVSNEDFIKIWQRADKANLQAQLQSARELLECVAMEPSLHSSTTLFSEMTLATGHSNDCTGCRIARFLEGAPATEKK